MKKYLMLMVAAASIATATFAQTKELKEKNEKYKRANVPAAVKQAFARQYPGVTAKWDKEDGKYEANFKHMNQEMSAIFEANGTMTESEMEISVNELPAAVRSYVKEHHKDAPIKEVAKITKANGEVNYETEVKGKDLIFDAAGKFIKESED